MNINQLKELAQSIKVKEDTLAQTKMIFNIYEKINYFRENFDEGCFLNLHIFRQREQQSISIMSGYKNDKRIVVDSDDLKKHINIYFPPEAFFEASDTSISFKNNSIGFQDFIKKLFKENYAYFNAVSLEINLSEKPNHKIKVPKI